MFFYTLYVNLREFSRLFFGDFRKILQIVSKYFILVVARLSGKSVRPVRDLARVFFLQTLVVSFLNSYLAGCDGCENLQDFNEGN